MFTLGAPRCQAETKPRTDLLPFGSIAVAVGIVISVLVHTIEAVAQEHAVWISKFETAAIYGHHALTVALLLSYDILAQLDVRTAYVRTHPTQDNGQAGGQHFSLILHQHGQAQSLGSRGHGPQNLSLAISIRYPGQA